MADLDWPLEMLDILIWHALKDPDPQREGWRELAPAGEYYYRGDPYTAGINSVRGEAAMAIARLLEYHGNLIDILKPVLAEMVHDPSIAVRSCVAAALTGLLKHDRSTAVELFLHLTEAEDILLGAPTSERFLCYAANTHFHSLSPLLHRMLRSSTDAARRSGAHVVCLAALVEKAAQQLVRHSLKGDEIQRTGAAEVFAAHLSVASFRRWCEKILADLFTDKSATVRSAASKCFYKLKGDNAEEFDWLIDRFTTSRACDDSCTPMLQLLENVPQPKPKTVFSVCQRFLAEVGTELSDIRSHSAIDSEKICKLLLRVYEQAQNDRIQNQALDLIDRLFSLHAYGIDKIQAYGER